MRFRADKILGRLEVRPLEKEFSINVSRKGNALNIEKLRVSFANLRLGIWALKSTEESS
jgi:hypothetical protein